MQVLALLAASQSILPSSLVIVPPFRTLTLREYFFDLASTNITATSMSSSILMVQVFDVFIHPGTDQSASIIPSAGTDVSSTSVPDSYIFEQFSPQSMPKSSLITVPSPAFVMVRVWDPGLSLSAPVPDAFRVKVAKHVLAPSIIAVIRPSVPEQSPLHSLNADPAAGVAVTFTLEP